MYENWQFKKESRLKKYFKSIGVNQTDIMFEIILNSYYKYFKDSTKNKEKIVSYYESYWKDSDQTKELIIQKNLLTQKRFKFIYLGIKMVNQNLLVFSYVNSQKQNGLMNQNLVGQK